MRVTNAPTPMSDLLFKDTWPCAHEFVQSCVLGMGLSEGAACWRIFMEKFTPHFLLDVWQQHTAWICCSVLNQVSDITQNIILYFFIEYQDKGFLVPIQKRKFVNRLKKWYANRPKLAMPINPKLEHHRTRHGNKHRLDMLTSQKLSW